MAFRRHLAGLGLGIAEAMDTAQRGMGLDWAGALDLIRRTKSELPDALVASGAGTDHLLPRDASSLDDVKRAYLEQVEAVQKCDSRIILMASRAWRRLVEAPRIMSASMARSCSSATNRLFSIGSDQCSTRNWRAIGAVRLLREFRNLPADHRRQRGQGGRYQDLPARQGEGNRHAASSAGGRPDVYR